MKRLFTILGLLICFLGLYSFKDAGTSTRHKFRVRSFHSNYRMMSDTIPIVNRSNNSLYVKDGRYYGGLNFNPPTYNDTASANTGTNLGNDYDGAVIYTKDSHWFWGRYNNVWIPFANTSGSVLPTCGVPSGTHLASYDSALVFGVTGGPYVLCCDGVARLSNDTTIVLPAADATNPRIDAVILDANGVNTIEGVPDPNPKVPQLTSCQLLLTYVLINAGQTVPAFVSQNNPLIIYDENYSTEWQVDSVSQLTIDTADMTFPVHLTHDIKISSYTVGSYFNISTDSTIDLNDYGVLKFYIRSTGAQTIKMHITGYLDDVPQTFGVLVQVAATGTAYQTVVISTASFRYLSTSQINKFQFEFEPSGTSPMYMDWIQLQSGIPPPLPVITGLQNLNVSDNTNITHSTVSFPDGPQTRITVTDQVQLPYTLLQNNTASSTTPIWGAIDLSTPIVTGLLPAANISPDGNDGDILTIQSGVSTYTPVQTDTTFFHNWEYRSTQNLSNNDTVANGYYKRDSSILAYDTYFGLNSHFADYTQGTADVFKLASNGSNNGLVTIGASRFETTSGASVAAANNLTLGADGNVFTISGNTQINAITTANWQSGSTTELIFSGTPTIKNNTAGGAGTAPILLAGSTDYTAAANDVLSIVYDGTNWHETSRKTSGTVSSQTLQQVFNTEIGGSVLAKSDTIQTGANHLNILGSAASPGVLVVKNSTASFGIFTQTIGGVAFEASTNTSSGAVNSTAVLGSAQGTTSGQNVGGDFESANGAVNIGVNIGNGGPGTNTGVKINTSGTGILISSGLDALDANVAASSTNTVITNSQFIRTTSGIAANGIGQSLDLKSQVIGGTSQISNQLISKWTDATLATRTSQLYFTGVLGSTTGTVFTINSDNSIQLTPITATAASAITPAEGMMLFVNSTNGTFLTVGFWGYQGGLWVKM